MHVCTVLPFFFWSKFHCCFSKILAFSYWTVNHFPIQISSEEISTTYGWYDFFKFGKFPIIIHAYAYTATYLNAWSNEIQLPRVAVHFGMCCICFCVNLSYCIHLTGHFWNHRKENKPSTDIWFIWWTHDSRTVQHDCWEVGRLPDWSRHVIEISISDAFYSIHNWDFELVSCLYGCVMSCY